MKSLNLARPQLLMVVGNPGAGKSFFARQFSETFNAPVVSFDRVRFELFANPQHTSDENELVGRIAAYMIEELLKTKRSLIVDGGCNAKVDRQKLGQFASKDGYDVHIIWVQTDAATCRTRALKRNPDKREDDKYSHSLSEDIFQRLAKTFTEPTRESHIVISGKHTYSAQAKMVLRKMVANREAEANAAHRQGVAQSKQASERPENGPPRRGIIVR